MGLMNKFGYVKTEQYFALDTQFRQKLEELTTLQNKLDEANKLIDQLESELADIKSERDALIINQEEHLNQISVLHMDLETAENTIADYKEQLEAAKEEKESVSKLPNLSPLLESFPESLKAVGSVLKETFDNTIKDDKLVLDLSNDTNDTVTAEEEQKPEEEKPKKRRRRRRTKKSE